MPSSSGGITTWSWIFWKVGHIPNFSKECKEANHKFTEALVKQVEQIRAKEKAVRKMTAKEGRAGSTRADRGASYDEVVLRADGVDTAAGKGAGRLKPHWEKRAPESETPSQLCRIALVCQVLTSC
jgi:hypothetical protein